MAGDVGLRRLLLLLQKLGRIRNTVAWWLRRKDAAGGCRKQNMS